MKISGLVVKVKSPYYIILANDGTYHKVPISGNPPVDVGAQAEFSTAGHPFGSFRYLKQAVLVASLLVMVMGFGIYNAVTGAGVAAYVSLDINPSIELEIDSDLTVTGVNLLNSDAERLLSGTPLKGARLSTAVDMIMSRALQDGCLKPGEKNLVLSTITLNGNMKKNIDFENLAAYLEHSVAGKEIDVEIVIASTDKTLRDEAGRQGISTGKLLVYRDALQSGKKLTIAQVKQNSLIQLENEFGVQILKNYEQRVIRKVHTAGGTTGNGPGDGGSQRDAGDDKKQNSDNDNQNNPGHNKTNNQIKNSSGKASKDNLSQVKKNRPQGSEPEQNRLQQQNQSLEQGQEQNEEQSHEQNQERNSPDEQQGQMGEQQEQNDEKNSSGDSGFSKPASSAGDSGKKQDSDTGTPDNSSEDRSGS